MDSKNYSIVIPPLNLMSDSVKRARSIANVEEIEPGSLIIRPYTPPSDIPKTLLMDKMRRNSSTKK